MIFRIVLKLFSRHLLLHLLIPLLIGLAVEIAIERLHAQDQVRDWPRYILSKERIGFFSGVIAAYLVIAFFLLYRETNIKINPGDLAQLHSVLNTAISYFAVSATPLPEWFEPYTQVYFSEVVSHQMRTPPLSHRRVIVFFRNAQFDDLRSDFLNGLPGKAFRDLHQHFKIPLGYLQRDELHEILSQLNNQELIQLKCIPRALIRSKRLASCYIASRRRIKSLAFAIVEVQNANPYLITFAKNGANVNLTCSQQPDVVDPYRKLASLIEGKVWAGGVLQPKNDFGLAIY